MFRATNNQDHGPKIIFVLCFICWLGVPLYTLSKEVVQLEYPHDKFYLGSVTIGSILYQVCMIIRECSCGDNEWVEAVSEGLAFEQMALHGRPLVESAKTARNLWRRHYARVSEVVLNVNCTMFCIGSSAVITLALLVHMGALLSLSWDQLGMEFIYFFPLLFNLFLAFTVIRLINIACDTVLLCVLEDHEVNGRAARNVPDKLRKLVLEAEQKLLNFIV